MPPHTSPAVAADSDRTEPRSVSSTPVTLADAAGKSDQPSRVEQATAALARLGEADRLSVIYDFLAGVNADLCDDTLDTFHDAIDAFESAYGQHLAVLDDRAMSEPRNWSHGWSHPDAGRW